MKGYREGCHVTKIIFDTGTTIRHTNTIMNRDTHRRQSMTAQIIDGQKVAKRIQDGIESQLLVMQTPFGYRRTAKLFRPEGDGLYAAILYVHWYESQAPDSNRRQFEAEAQEMARDGAVCLLIETLWSDLDFFYKRTQEEDGCNPALPGLVPVRSQIGGGIPRSIYPPNVCDRSHCAYPKSCPG